MVCFYEGWGAGVLVDKSSILPTLGTCVSEGVGAKTHGLVVHGGESHVLQIVPFGQGRILLPLQNVFFPIHV